MKQEIVSKYNALRHADKCEVTGAALDFLAGQGILVARNTLHYWRNTKYSRSPLDRKYAEAYQYALETMQSEETAQPV